MGTSFIDRLLDLIASPLGLIGLVAGLSILVQAKRSRPLAWLLFSFCGFAASLAKFQNQWILEPPALVFPLQQLRELGRPLTIVLLFLLLALGLWTHNHWRRLLTPQPFKYLVLVQIIILLKTLTYGSIAFAFLAILTFGAVVLMVRLGPCQWLQDEENFRLGAWSVAMVGVIFVGVNAYQAVFNIYPITFIHGWLLGTTGNPHHAAALLAATVPCFMFLIESHTKWNRAKVFWVGTLTAVMIALFMTASRNGLMMGIASILIFYRHKGGALLRLGLVMTFVLAIALPFLTNDGSILAANSSAVTDKFASGENTRAGVWAALFNTFLDYPLFGAPLVGDRLGYGESSWLAAGATLGLLGFIPLLLFGFGCLKMMLRLNQLSSQKEQYSLHSSVVIAGLTSLLVGSFFEAFLLGNLTFPLLALLMYLSLGQYLIELDYVENRNQYLQSVIPDQMLWRTNE